MTPKTDLYQEALVATYISAARSSADIQVIELSFAARTAHAGNVAVCQVPVAVNGGALWLMGSLLPAHGTHAHQFVAIFDSDSIEALKFVAAAAHYHAYVEPLAEGHTASLGPLSPLRPAYDAFLVYDAACLACFPSPSIRLGAVDTAIFGVLPVTTAERQLVHAVGIEEAWQHLTSTRDLLAFPH